MKNLVSAESPKPRVLGSLYLVQTLIGGVDVQCHGVTLILIFDLATVTLTLKILSTLYL